MTATSIPRPATDEAAPFYQAYIAEVRGENIGDLLREQGVEVERLFQPLDDTRALERYAPGKWSVKEVLGHITDAERIFAYRLLRIARGDKTPLPGFDEDAYVPAAHFDRRAVAELIEDFLAVRTSSRTLVGGIPPESWTLVGEASGKAISARALAYIMVGHVAHHVAVLRERYRLG